MKQFVRGRCSRAISSLLVALFLLPCLIMPLCTAAQAETEGPQNIILLPLSTSVGNAPNNLGGRIFKELQLSLASHVGTQVMELLPTSPIYARAKEQLSEEAKSDFDDQYNKAIDAATEKEARKKAAGALARELNVDCVVYGIDR